MSIIGASARNRPAVLGIASLAAVFALAGCGGGSSDAEKDDPVIQTSAARTTSPSSTPAPTPATSTSATGATGGNGTSVPAGSTPKLTNPGTSDRKVTLSGDTYTPTSLDIKTGEIVTFSATDGKTHAVKITGIDAATVSGGLMESFVFPGPGTFAVTDEVGKATMTIRVLS